MITDVYCKICDKRMDIGDSMVGHILEFHPRAFADLIIQLNPKIVPLSDIYFEIRPTK